ncbi:MAG: carboxypeptidase regulatory-like domain-containing protein [Symploca sp. SIO2E6]|nr:carboxypeptidase regulatory-like domain-containing protein [Symploca sp. SIO2E6]
MNSSNSSVLQQQDQRITGLVTKVTGNQMPTVGENDSRNQPQPIQTKVWIFSGQITAQGTRWPREQARQHSNLVGWITTNTNGSFSVGLPPGEYTIFIEDGTDLYLNSFLGNGNYESVEVTEGEITEINIVNTEEATF